MDYNNVEQQIAEWVDKALVTTHKIKIVLEGFQCNGHPYVEINIDSKNKFKGTFIGLIEHEIEYQVDKNKNCNIDIVMKHKTDDNVIFTDKGIIQNQYVVIKDILIDNISLTKNNLYFWDEHTFIKEDGEDIGKTNGLFHNGVWNIALPNPIMPGLNDIAQNKKGNIFRSRYIEDQSIQNLIDKVFYS